jgi:hypothetical protein
MLARQEQRYAEQQEDWRQPRQIEREHPRHQGRADIRAQHDGKTTGKR